MEKCTECLKKMKRTIISLSRNYFKKDVIVHHVPVWLCKCGEYYIISEYVNDYREIAHSTYMNTPKYPYVVEVDFKKTNMT